MSRGLNRSERLKEMERLYVQHGYTDIEMADRLSVTRPTAYKDRIELEREIPFTKDANGRWRINRSRYISEIRVDLYEALVLYLAARRSSRQHQLAGKHAASGVEKLATALRQPMTQRLVKTADTILSQKAIGERTAVLETIAHAWAENIKVRLVYQALESRQTKTHLVTPYLIEPSHWSDSTYLIGHSDLNNDIIPFKIERIERATLTTEQFEPPDSFDEQTLLRHAWGIWYADKDPITIKLRFAPGRATRRLKESVWHPTEEVTDTEDGGCIWQAKVDEWQEMLPWIRGWGADCEVLEPLGLRREIEREVMRAAEVYHIQLKALSVDEDEDDYDSQWFKRMTEGNNG
jgi:CRISPR-associated endonuclease/helicase Cas3